MTHKSFLKIEVLNDDFRRTNSDAGNTWFQAADKQIEFCLAKVDPNGNSTNDITRKSTTREYWSGYADNAMKSSASGFKKRSSNTTYLR